jgi:hypothetical protein
MTLDSMLTIKKRALEWNVGPDGGVGDCLAVISQVVDQIDALADAGMLTFMHDVTSCALSEATLLIYKVSERSSSPRPIRLACPRKRLIYV